MTAASPDRQKDSPTRLSRGANDRPTIFLDYRLGETVAPGADLGFRHVERWYVSIHGEPPGEPDERAAIGYAQLIILNLTPGVGIGDLADRESGEWVDVIEPVPSGEGGTGSAQNAPGALGHHILVLDRLWLEPAWRGRGLGPVAAAAAVLRLARGCRFVACYPAPFEPTGDPDADNPQTRARSIEALGVIWAKVGFRPRDDGVWMLDLATTDLHAVLQGLLRPQSQQP